VTAVSGLDHRNRALHVVAGCDKITAYYEAQKVTRSARVVRVLRSADLVLLKILGAPNAQVLVVDPKPPSLTDQLSTLGYPLQVLSMSSTSLQLRYGGKTLRNIVPESVAQALSGGSLSLDLEIDSIEGHLLPGHSGAPIFNEQRKIVAIADGGLENGAAALSCGVPARLLNQLATSDEHPQTTVAAASSHAVLFAAENEVRNLGETTCSGTTLTRLRSANFAHLYKSVDDPAGLIQTIKTIKVDPSNFRFDVYQHLPSGATFVLPLGAELKQAENGDCTALLPSGKVSAAHRGWCPCVTVAGTGQGPGLRECAG
jgi:Trypsin-like peptidase domain